MFFTSATEQHKQTARQEFEQLHRRGQWTRLWSSVLGRQYRLLRLDEAQYGRQFQSRSDAGIQTVPMDEIHGSDSRSADFDRQWRPLTNVNQERWTNIAVAHMTDVALPAIDLIKMGEAYFVRDGHHRVSVAKYQGQIEIEANVTEWQIIAAPDGGAKSIRNVENNALERSFGQVTQALETGMAQVSVLVGVLQRELSLRAASILGRLQRPYNNGTTA